MNLFKKNEIDIIIDNSEFYDFELVDSIIDYGIDIILDNSDVFDYELTNDEINYENLTEMSPSCLDCDDIILSLQFGFLLNDKYEYLLTLDGEFLVYH